MPDAVLDRLDDIEALLSLLPVSEYAGVAFVAKKMGVDEQYLRRRPYLMPGWGVTEVPGKLSWSMKTIRAWLEVSPAQRDAEWHSLSSAVRAAICRKRSAK